ncbi:dedicator of cytokinesis protein 3-like [Leptidea sinapis]|uniref:dedicator of cytokinesis protein 3-like n=1 Tax=Leptidea sinapis TaxID=189913 RepID=UPI0021C29C00|nr:dedicator of cytokinesis protein 3-like [Leptidea sinapis]
MERVSTEGWREAGAAFVGCVTRLLERLLDYRAVMQGAEHRDKRMSATVNLLNFYKNEIDRKEMYLRYVYKLHDLHISSDNFVEAGCTLLLYAETLSWESDQVGVDPEHPETPEWKRKEALYNQVLQYFDRGKCWEKGLPLLRELATLYEMKLCDYPRLAECLRTYATFLDSVMKELRPEPEYFRVGFYGKGCPPFVRNKQFVYRGHEYERIGAFTQRLQAEYVSAHILMRNTPPDESVISADGQYIQICNVKPVARLESCPSNAPEQVKRFYSFNDVNTFLSDRPLHKPPIDKDNEFKSLWIERTTLVTENILPGILRWSEVVTRSVEEITPVEFACETMESTERELRNLISQYTADPSRNINPFSMRLQGTIDANVQGGISKYEQAFLSAEFGRNASPREAAAAARLRRLVTAQLAVVDAGLALHARLAPADVRPLHR